MTRAEAREIAAALCFAGVVNHSSGEELISSFFDKEYYYTLNDEGFTEVPNARDLEYITTIVNGVLEHQDEIDFYIEKYSKGWKLSRISKTALAVMRVSIFEIFALEDVPVGVAINEAVEISKGFEEPETVAFINGVLGTFARSSDCARVLGEADQCAIEEIMQATDELSTAAVVQSIYGEDTEEEAPAVCENQIVMDEIME